MEWTGRIKAVPWSVMASAAALGAIGWVALDRANELNESTLRFHARQLVWWVPAAVLCWSAAVTNYRLICRWSYAAFAVTGTLLVAVYFFPAVNGAHRWIRVGGIGWQPSEAAKLVFVLALARYLMYCASQRKLRGLLGPLAIGLVPMVLVLREPDLGTALVFPPVLFVMLVAAGARLRDLGLAVLLGICLAPLLWTQMSREQRSRVTALWEQNAPDERPTDDGYHLHQSKQVIALGGAWGSLILGDYTLRRSVYRLPVAHSDFILAIIAERLGVWGVGLVLLLFALLVHRVLRVASATREPFGRLLCVGVAAWFGVEVIVNSAMTVGLAPVTGLSLPLVSYGGSGLLAHVLGLGLVASVALHPGYELGADPFVFRDE